METLGKHFSSLAKAAFERYGFAQGDLLSHWAAIAGDDVSAFCSPERIKWPRRAEGNRSGGATLVLRVDPGRALDIQYKAPILLERINQFFGYGAIATIKVMPGSRKEPQTPPRRSVAPTPSAAVQEKLGMISDDRLKDALARLGAEVAAAARSPQAK